MSRKTHVKANWPKYLLQWGSLAAIIFFVSGLAAKIFTKMTPADPETYCPMGGLQALVTYIVRGSLPCSMTTVQMLMGIALGVAIILFSKLFCAFLCPIGTVEDLLTKLRKTLKIKALSIRRGGVADKLLRIVKWGLLFWIFYTTAGASELFCKALDPYYAVATGFKGEITLWMSITSVALVVLGGLFVDRFWCLYICPLGAASAAFKYWPHMVAICLVFWAVQLLGLGLEWYWLLAAVCLIGYLLEIFYRKPKAQLLHVVRDEAHCNGKCLNCMHNCPYSINVPGEGRMVSDVDCMLCGECVAACPHDALSISVCKPAKRWTRFLPAILAAVLFVVALLVGQSFEFPTIDESWGITEGMKTETFRMSGIKTVKCYGSSMAFKARMEKVPGVHGVKTYVGSHTVVVKYDPAVTDADKVQEAIFTPSHFRIWSPDPAKLQELKVVTIRTEKMYDKLDLNYLGLQFRTTGKSIFGVVSEYACPLIIKVYMSPDENLDEAWFREVVERKVLEMPVHGGGVKETPVDFKFVRLEPGEERIGIDEYLHMMFDTFSAEFSGRYPSADTTVVRKRKDVYAGEPQYVYEIAEQGYEKPIIKRALPYLSNFLSSQEGVIAFNLCLNKDLVPSIQIRFAAPATADRIWQMLSAEKWTVTYKEGDVREEDPRMKFPKQGICYRYEE